MRGNVRPISHRPLSILTGRFRFSRWIAVSSSHRRRYFSATGGGSDWQRQGRGVSRNDAARCEVVYAESRLLFFRTFRRCEVRGNVANFEVLIIFREEYFVSPFIFFKKPR